MTVQEILDRILGARKLGQGKVKEPDITRTLGGRIISIIKYAKRAEDTHNVHDGGYECRRNLIEMLDRCIFALQTWNGEVKSFDDVVAEIHALRTRYAEFLKLAGTGDRGFSLDEFVMEISRGADKLRETYLNSIGSSGHEDDTRRAVLNITDTGLAALEES